MGNLEGLKLLKSWFWLLSCLRSIIVFRHFCSHFASFFFSYNSMFVCIYFLLLDLQVNVNFQCNFMCYTLFCQRFLSAYYRDTVFILRSRRWRVSASVFPCFFFLFQVHSFVFSRLSHCWSSFALGLHYSMSEFS